MTPRRLTSALAVAAACVVLPGAPGASAAAPAPYSKPGLWTLTNTLGEGKPPMVTRLCIDKATQRRLIAMGHSTLGSMCSRHTETVIGSTVTSESVCKMGGSTLTSRRVITFSGDTAFHTETHGTFSPPSMGRKTTQAVQDARWIGRCPAGMAPGDLIGPNGMKMHIGAKGMVPIR